MYYAYAVNTERNSITTSMFKDYINITYPKEGGNFDLTEVSKNAVIIVSAILTKIMKGVVLHLKQRCIVNVVMQMS